MRVDSMVQFQQETLAMSVGFCLSGLYVVATVLVGTEHWASPQAEGESQGYNPVLGNG